MAFIKVVTIELEDSVDLKTRSLLTIESEAVSHPLPKVCFICWPLGLGLPLPEKTTQNADICDTATCRCYSCVDPTIPCRKVGWLRSSKPDYSTVGPTQLLWHYRSINRIPHGNTNKKMANSGHDLAMVSLFCVLMFFHTSTTNQPHILRTSLSHHLGWIPCQAVGKWDCNPYSARLFIWYPTHSQSQVSNPSTSQNIFCSF